MGLNRGRLRWDNQRRRPITDCAGAIKGIIKHCRHDQTVSLGIYISVPFCRTKCSYCNFASDVFSRVLFDRYVERVCADIENAPVIAREVGGQIERGADSVYLGGGTPTVLDTAQLERIFATARANLEVQSDAEITVECAPGTLTQETLDALLRCGVNRVSLGVQSFVDQEAAAVGRLHKRTTVLEDISRLRAAGITNINVDLIAGLPHQTAESWNVSLEETIATGVPHVSVYMLEVDEDSRGVPQYEISNFARQGFQSRHNLKYWTRQPYFGFGVDAHSMLVSATPDQGAVRFASPDSLEHYIAEAPLQRTEVSRQAALEESFFLGLRLTRGLDLGELSADFGEEALGNFENEVSQFLKGGLMEIDGRYVRLTPQGRLLSNEVFQRFLSPLKPAEVVRATMM